MLPVVQMRGDTWMGRIAAVCVATFALLAVDFRLSVSILSGPKNAAGQAVIIIVIYCYLCLFMSFKRAWPWLDTTKIRLDGTSRRRTCIFSAWLLSSS